MKIALAAAFALLAAAAPRALADTGTEPLWEAGLGAGVVDFPDYRGSSHSRAYVLPVPYLVYRGRVLQADRRGLRGIFLDTERVDINMSFGASLPVASSDNPARRGMPDLRPAVELGPSLEVTLWRAANRQAKLDFRLPVRAAVTIEASPRFVGTQLTPQINLDVVDPFGARGWNLGMLAGPVYTDRRYNRYFYDVPPAYATAERPAYAARGGFGGTELIVALSKRFPKFWVGAFARYDSLRGAVYESSPLVTSRSYFAGGIGVSWIFRESAERVPVNEMGDRER